MSLINTIIEAARAQGINQKALAQALGLREESFSRLKARGTIKSDMLERMANVVGLELTLRPVFPAPINAKFDKLPFREKYKTLVWSNSNAPDAIFIQRALLRPDFSMLLDAASEFGVPALVKEWAYLEAQGGREVEQASVTTTRMLRHIQLGV